MSDLGAKEWQWILSGPAFDRGSYQARQMRGESRPDWMEAFLMAHSKGDPTVNAKTGVRHTVESMVSDLRERVKLDSITKEASAEPPLACKSAQLNSEQQEMLDIMTDYVVRYFILPERGRSPIPALYESIKDKFGVQAIIIAGGPETVKDMLKRLKEEHESPNLAESLPTYDGQPLTVHYDSDMRDSSNFMTQDKRTVF